MARGGGPRIAKILGAKTTLKRVRIPALRFELRIFRFVAECLVPLGHAGAHGIEGSHFLYIKGMIV